MCKGTKSDASSKWYQLHKTHIEAQSLELQPDTRTLDEFSVVVGNGDTQTTTPTPTTSVSTTTQGWAPKRTETTSIVSPTDFGLLFFTMRSVATEDYNEV